MGGWKAEEILFVEQGLSGCSETCQDQGKGNSGGAEKSTRKTVGTLCANDSKGVNNQFVEQGKLVVDKCYCIGNGQTDQLKLKKKVGALNCMHQQQAVLYSAKSYFEWQKQEKSSTLTSRGRVLGPCGSDVVVKPKFYDIAHKADVYRTLHDKTNTLNARMGTGGNNVPILCYCSSGNIIGRQNKNGGNHMGISADKAYTLTSIDRRAVECSNIVRRLTPLECERLQGLPDNYTNVPYKGKEAPDTKRYKAIGNGMAQPCADFVIRQIVFYIKEGE